MDGQHARIVARSARLVDDLEERGAHLLEAEVEGDLAGERDAVSPLHLVGDPRLAEEGGNEHARVVEHVKLDDLHARPRALEHDLVDDRDDGGVDADVGVTDGHHRGEVEVAMGHVKQQIAHAGDAQTRERLSPRRAGATREVAKSRYVIGEAAGSLQPLRGGSYGGSHSHPAGHLPTRARR